MNHSRPSCPICSSVHIETRHLARKTGGVIGTAAGSIGGAVTSLSGAEIGMTVGLIAGPPGMAVGGFLGALLGAFVGGTAGCLTGTRLGELIDERVLDNHRCLACGHCFSARTVPEDLSKTPKSGERLKPIVVFHAGTQWVVLDGHHRMQAYRRAEWRKEIPVQVFTGSMDEAIARANVENHRSQLAMTNAEKMSAAWRMVCATSLTAAKIRHATGASMRSIASMREARKALLAKEHTLESLSEMSWHLARSTAKGEANEPTDWDKADEKEAQELANELAKLLGKRLHGKHHIIAMALEAYDSRLPNTLRELWDDERGLSNSSRMRRTPTSEGLKESTGYPAICPSGGLCCASL